MWKTRMTPIITAVLLSVSFLHSLTAATAFTIIMPASSAAAALLPDAARTDPAEQAAVYDVMRATGNAWAADIPDVCRGRWHGIECMPDRENVFHVVSLSFGALSDDTAFPTCDSPYPTISPSVVKLPHLRTLFFYRCLNSNPQPIPAFIGRLGGSLRTLVLRENGHVGEIPYELGNLTGLTVLDLHKNGLGGSVPVSLNQITGLRSLDLSSNRLAGSIPGISFPELRVLDLNQNHLTGPVPVGLVSGAGLIKIDLSRNRFTGPIPALDSLPELILLDLSYNALVGPLPESFRGLKSLQALILKGNAMESVTIPECTFEGLNNLTVLVLSGMTLEGAIPSSLGDLAALRVVHLDENRFNGSIPASLGKMGGLSELRLDKNLLIGPVPFTRDMIWRMGRKLKLGNNLGLCYHPGSGLGEDLDTLSGAGIGRCGDETVGKKPGLSV